MLLTRAAGEEEEEDEEKRERRGETRQSARIIGAMHAPYPKNESAGEPQIRDGRCLLAVVWPAEAGWPHLEIEVPRSNSIGTFFVAFIVVVVVVVDVVAVVVVVILVTN